MDRSLQKKLENLSEGSVIFDCSLARYNSFAVGGPADALVVVKEREELLSLMRLVEVENLPWRAIGKGSNLLVRDEGFRGLVIVLGGSFQEIKLAGESQEDSVVLHVGGGCSLTKLNHFCSREGYGGLTFSYGIPGSVGGAVRMNAGAWGSEIASVLTGVCIVTAKGFKTLTADQLDFTYRNWPYLNRYNGRAIITGAMFSLSHMDRETLKSEMKLLLEKRKKVQPHNYPNGGSCFKNPEGKSAGQMIEECGLKGECIGGAMVSEKHANFIINYNKATAQDVLSLIARVQKRVRHRFDINLEPEIHVM